MGCPPESAETKLRKFKVCTIFLTVDDLPVAFRNDEIQILSTLILDNILHISLVVIHFWDRLEKSNTTRVYYNETSS